MKRGTEIFHLIHSLTKSEKRYISLFQNGKESGVIVSMFEAIEKYRSDNEKKFKELNSAEKFIKNYSYNKFYLYKLVLKKLAEYNREKSVDGKIHNMIMDCKVLFAKALYSQYFKSIQKAKEFAHKHERHGYFLQILDMEKIIIKKQEIQTEKGKAIYDQAMHSINHMKNSFNLSRISNILLSDFRVRGVKRDKSHELNIEGLFTDKLSSNFDELAAKEKETYYRIQEIAYESQGDFINTHKMQVKRLKIIRKNPDAFKDNIINHELDTLSSLLTSTLRLNKTDETLKLLNEYRAKTGKSPADSGDYEIMESLILFQISMRRSDLKEAKKYLPQLNILLEKYNNKMLIDTELTIRYYMVVYYIMANDFSNASKNSNELLSHPLIEKREDYLSYLKILNLIIHFELKNYSLLSYLIKSTYRFLFKRNKLYKLEFIVMDFLRKLTEIKDQDDLKFNLIQLKKKMEELTKNQYEKNAFVYFDFLHWLSSKINKITI